MFPLVNQRFVLLSLGVNEQTNLLFLIDPLNNDEMLFLSFVELPLIFG